MRRSGDFYSFLRAEIHSITQQEQIFGANATRFYRLKTLE